MTPRRRPSPLYAIVAFLLVALGYLCFELGRYQAGYSVLDQRRQRAAINRLLTEERAASEELRRQLAIAETSREIDRATYEEVEADLGELQARIQEQEEELVFYRGIVSPQDGVAGLRIQSLEVAPADAERHYLLRLVLVQAIVHSRRVAGVVRLDLHGVQAGEPVFLELEDLLAAQDDTDACDMAYAFRYFQGLECELVLPVGFEPTNLQVEIWPSEPSGEPVTEAFEWLAVAG